MIPLMKNAFLNEHETKKAKSNFILQADRLSMDKECARFEEKFSNYQGRKEAILFNSGGSANLAMIQALKNLGKLKAGDKVGFSALTWSTNTMPIIQMGLVPVAVDCEVKFLNVTSKNLLDTLEKTELNAFFLTNVLGFTGDIDNIKKICLERNIILIEDNEVFGYGYTNLHYQENKLEILKSILTPIENKISSKNIIKNYLNSHNVEKIIRL